MRWYRARTLREWAEVHLSRGEPEDVDRARQLFEAAKKEFEAMDMPYYAGQVRESLEQLNSGDGHGSTF